MRLDCIGVHMENALKAADEIFGMALQLLNDNGVDAKLVPLVMGTVAQRVEQFAIGAIAGELAAIKNGADTEEVDNG